MKGHVYVLNPNLTIDGQSIVKIGMTTRSVESRVRELSTGSPIRFDIAYSIEADDARGLEQTLHRRFASLRVRAGGGTEYFRVSVQEVVFAIESIATEISSKRASDAFAADLLAFKINAGIHRLERRIGVAVALFTLLLAILFIFLVKGVLGPFTILFMLFVGLPVFSFIGLKLDEIITERAVGSRFGIQLAGKLSELAKRYPLSIYARYTPAQLDSQAAPIIVDSVQRPDTDRRHKVWPKIEMLKIASLVESTFQISGTSNHNQETLIFTHPSSGDSVTITSNCGCAPLVVTCSRTKVRAIAASVDRAVFLVGDLLGLRNGVQS